MFKKIFIAENQQSYSTKKHATVHFNILNSMVILNYLRKSEYRMKDEKMG